jgi:hypothetical protein
VKITRTVEVLQVGEDDEGKLFASFCAPGGRDGEVLRIAVGLDEARALGGRLYSEVEITIDTEVP